LQDNLKIKSFGPIKETKKGDRYRHVTILDLKSNIKTDYLVYEKKKRNIWSDIENHEKVSSLPSYTGYISNYNKLDVVVFDGEKLKDAFEKQKWRLNYNNKIPVKEAEQMKNSSCGWISDLTREHSMEIHWRELDPDITKVKFRSYIGNGNFKWSKWFEIE